MAKFKCNTTDDATLYQNLDFLRIDGADAHKGVQLGEEGLRRLIRKLRKALRRMEGR